jgi:hypothetical protein
MLLSSEGTPLASSLQPATLFEAQRLSAVNRLLLVWLPPEGDNFSHIRIYRSTAADQKGELIADRVTGMTFVDHSVTAGTTYFYKLFAVNRSGKEMRKAASLTVFRFGNSTPYSPFAKMPGAGMERQLSDTKNTVITVPLVLSEEEIKNSLGGRNKLLLLDPASNQWRKTNSIEPGRGYFVQDQLVPLDVVGKPLPEHPFEVSLQRGWNVIGNPFLKAVDVDQISIEADGKNVSLTEAAKRGFVADYLYGYVNGRWYVASILEGGVSLPPWRGVYLLASEDAILRVSPLR